ncbi:MAG: glycosyltransferase family 2 protein [Chitinophagales bacterium]|nr:glycosyltransferase family 2 protein [Chitinophagales bacterium]
MNKNIAIVILNYNGKQHLQQFLPSVIQHSKLANCKIIVADNASTDDSTQYLQENFANQIELIVLDKNYGFAEGYNRALQQIKSDYYILLNSDVEVTANWISPVIDYIEQDDLMVAAQPKLLAYHNKKEFEYAGAAGGFIDKYGYPFCRGRIFNTCEVENGQYNQNSEIFWASGACLFIKADAFHLVGGFDGDFFAHMEEIDLCWRLKNLGYKIGYCANSTVFHVGGGTLHKSNPKKTYLNFRNNRALLRKNLSGIELSGIYKMRNRLDKIAWLKSLLTNKDESKAIKKALADYNDMIDDLNNKKIAFQKIQQQNAVAQPNKHGIYNSSIVVDYYIKQKKLFSQLNFNI